MLASLIAWASASPLIQRILVPALTEALTRFFEKQASKIEARGAVKAAKSAKTAEQIRDASKRISDATARR